jgi:ATP-dependent helicase HrpA
MDLHELRAQFAAAREALLLQDAARLSRQLRQAKEGRFDSARFVADCQRAQQRAERRAASRPAQIEYPTELPVSQARETLLESLRAHQVVVVCGETGSGKTTQLPKLCLELGYGRRGLIGHTQPRRLAARSVAHRIAQELKSPLGALVGFETRFDKRVSEQTLIKLMTDGILLAELQRDRELLAYDALILDEAHERSLNIDFLLGWLKQLVSRRPELKLIITSATLDPDKLAAHFNIAGKPPVPVVNVSGRGYPVDIRYRPPEPDSDPEDAVAAAIDELWHSARPADVLVFLPGEREIHDLARSLPGRFPRAQILPLYSRLPAQQQDRVFSPGGPPRIVLSTNVAETSVTVPGIRYVIDVGTARINRWSTRLGIQQLHIEPVSQAAAQQRAGRCGRTGPGICVRLYDETDFAARPAFTDPEILRANLAGVILQMSALSLGEVEDFAWLDAPDSRKISEGYRLLQTLGALDEERRLTALGRELARLPLDPRVGRIALAGRNLSCADEVFVLAAALSVQDPHEVPPEAQTQARQKHAEWRHARSDFLGLLQLWWRWRAWSEQASNRQLRKLCREHYVSYLRMEEWEAVYRQIVDLLGAKTRTRSAAEQAKVEDLYAPLHQALLAGLVDHIGVKLPEKPEYQGPRGRRFRVFPASALAKKPPPWILCASIVQTSQVFARGCATLDPEWLLEVAPHLVKRTMLTPQWNPTRGEVSCTEQRSIFGLPLGSRTRHFGSTNPAEAREIFIRDALVQGEMPNKPAFLQQNLQLIESVREKEARLRRPDLLVDDDTLFRWYAARLPAEVCTTAALKKWLHQNGAPRDGRGASPLRMREEDVLRSGANAEVHTLFPDHLDLAGHRLRLSYAHEPGQELDGVSFHIPLALLFQLPPERFDWLVPGLLAARIEGLIRTLPQQLRRLCTPAAEYARALDARMSVEDGALADAICRHFQAMTGVQLRPEDFQPDKLEPHLRPRLVLEGEQGRVLASAESLHALQTRHAAPAREALNQTAARDAELRRWTREDLRDWDFGDLPESVILAGGARAYPALYVDAGRVGLRLYESAETAATAHRVGVTALLLAKLADRVKDLTKIAKSRLQLALLHSVHTTDTLALACAERAADATWSLPTLRTQAAFQEAVLKRGEFGRLAARTLDEACDWLLTAAELRRRLRALEPRWPEARADIAAQLDSLLPAGFVTQIPAAQWPRIGIYLKAIGIRLDRLPNKPVRDLDLTMSLRAWTERLPHPFHPARWIIEEWRVSLFAQELLALGGPSEARIRAALHS